MRPRPQPQLRRTENEVALLGFLLIVVVLTVGLGVLLGLNFRRLNLGRKKLMPESHNSRAGSEVATPRKKPLASSLAMRTILIGSLALLMLIPLSMVGSTVEERHQLYRTVLDDIAGIWGSRQVLEGPALVVPYVEKVLVEETVKDEKTGEETTTSKVIFNNLTAVVLPKNLSVEVELHEQMRHRGIYKALVYTAGIRLRGKIERPNIDAFSENLHRVDWGKAYLVLSLSDTRAINEASVLTWNGRPQSLAPGTRLTGVFGNGFHAPLETLDSGAESHAFDLSLSINGSQGIRFAPFGEETQIRMVSSWPHPSFQGAALPTAYEARDDGFEATWSIPHLARNYPQLFSHPAQAFELSEFLVGVDLFEPVFLYSKVTRAVKYGLLFVGLTFLVFLIFELISSARLHFVQYGLIGISLSVFFLTLLSLAEHIDFRSAYVLASVVNIGLITLYTGAVLRSWARASIVLVLLSTLYTLLYSLLHMEDYALLIGTILLLSVVAILMVLTRDLKAAAGDNEPGPV